MERVTQIIIAVALTVGLVGSANATKMTLAELGAQYTNVYEDANIDFSDGCVYFSCAGNLLVNGFFQGEQSSSSDDSFNGEIVAVSGSSYDEPTKTSPENDEPEVVNVAEPGTLALLVLSIVGLLIFRRKKKTH